MLTSWLTVHMVSQKSTAKVKNFQWGEFQTKIKQKEDYCKHIRDHGGSHRNEWASGCLIYVHSYSEMRHKCWWVCDLLSRFLICSCLTLTDHHRDSLIIYILPVTTSLVLSSHIPTCVSVFWLVGWFIYLKQKQQIKSAWQNVSIQMEVNMKKRKIICSFMLNSVPGVFKENCDSQYC